MSVFVHVCVRAQQLIAATYWTTTTNLNAASSLDSTFGSDAKYNGYNYGQYNQILPRFALACVVHAAAVIVLFA